MGLKLLKHGHSYLLLLQHKEQQRAAVIEPLVRVMLDKRVPHEVRYGFRYFYVSGGVSVQFSRTVTWLPYLFFFLIHVVINYCLRSMYSLNLLFCCI